MSFRIPSGRTVLRSFIVATVALGAAACSDSSVPTSPQARPSFDVTPSAPQTFTFASGVNNGAGRDEATIVVAYNDPFATPLLGGQVVPFPSYVIVPNPAYGLMSGAAWVGPFPNSGLLADPTHDANYTFERQFSAPAHSTATSLVLNVMSDNAVTVSLNGAQIGQQTQADIGSNFQSIVTYTGTVGAGTNTLSFFVRNGINPNAAGGPAALIYRATVTYTCDEGFGPSNGQCVDLTPPVVDVTVEGDKIIAGGDWFTSDVTVTFTATDDQSAVTTSGCEPQNVNSDTPGTVFTCTATSEGGTTTRDVTVMRDATPPTVFFSGAMPTYTADQTISITCTVFDETSGLLSSSCPAISGPASNFIGFNNLAANGIDNAGNSSVAIVSFTVSVTCESLSSLISQRVTGEKWVKRLNVHLRNVCDKTAKNSPAKDEQVKNFIREVGKAQDAGAISPADAGLLSALVQAI